MPDHRKGVIAGEQPSRDRLFEVLGLGHAPGVRPGHECRHEWRIERSRMIGADDERAFSRHVLRTAHLEYSCEVDVHERTHQPAQERVHLQAPRARTRSTMSSTTWSTSSLSVLMTIASPAGRSGATCLSVSTRSRTSTSLRIASASTRSPLRSY